MQYFNINCNALQHYFAFSYTTRFSVRINAERISERIGELCDRKIFMFVFLSQNWKYLNVEKV